MVSVIVPVYNVGNLLKPCIESILHSTYRDLELILIDDGSTDGSGLICDEYAFQDSRIHIIHQQNAGVAMARNAGLDLAKGDYILFVDNDDVIHPQMIAILFDAINSGDYGFSMAWAVKTTDSNYYDLIEKRIDESQCKRKVLSQDDLIKGLFGTYDIEYQYIAVWNKLYKKAFLDNLRFVKTPGDDLLWNTQLFMKARNVILVESELYCWIQHPSSVSHQSVSHFYVHRIDSYYLSLESIPKNKSIYRAYCLEKIQKVILNTKFHARNTRNTAFYDEACMISSEVYKKTIKEFLNSSIPRLKKIGLLLFYHVPFTYSLFIKMINLKGR